MGDRRETEKGKEARDRGQGPIPLPRLSLSELEKHSAVHGRRRRLVAPVALRGVRVYGDVCVCVCVCVCACLARWLQLALVRPFPSVLRAVSRSPAAHRSLRQCTVISLRSLSSTPLFASPSTTHTHTHTHTPSSPQHTLRLFSPPLLLSAFLALVTSLLPLPPRSPPALPLSTLPRLSLSSAACFSPALRGASAWPRRALSWPRSPPLCAPQSGTLRRPHCRRRCA